MSRLLIGAQFTPPTGLLQGPMPRATNHKQTTSLGLANSTSQGLRFVALCMTWQGSTKAGPYLLCNSTLLTCIKPELNINHGFMWCENQATVCFMLFTMAFSFDSAVSRDFCLQNWCAVEKNPIFSFFSYSCGPRDYDQQQFKYVHMHTRAQPSPDFSRLLCHIVTEAEMKEV